MNICQKLRARKYLATWTNDLKWYSKRDSSAAQRKRGPKWIARELNHKQNFDSVTEGIQEHDTPDGLMYMWSKENRNQIASDCTMIWTYNN